MSKVVNPFQITFLLAFFTNFIHSKKKLYSVISNLNLFCFAFFEKLLRKPTEPGGNF